MVPWWLRDRCADRAVEIDHPRAFAPAPACMGAGVVDGVFEDADRTAMGIGPWMPLAGS
jgi:hypothetical protein